jgi:hypothetical protein
MGSWTDFYVDDFSIACTKSYVIPALMCLFRESDRNVQKELPNHPDEEPRRTVWYRTTRAAAIARLELMGFNLARVHAEFDENRSEAIETLSTRSWDAEAESKIASMDSLTFEQWCASMRRIVALGLSTFEDIHRMGAVVTPLESELLLSAGFLFQNSDVRTLVRAILEALPDATGIGQDVSAVVDGGWYDEDEPIVETCLNGTAEEHQELARIIVLTEGRTDSRFISRSLKLLYPEFWDYYRFLDFAQNNQAGGAGQLVHIVKGFIGSGIVNRVVAIFDNDTAAADSIRGLAGVDVPPNIKILHYPSLELGTNYPTVGPTGSTPFDVNGLAGSLELYFGRDVLQAGDGDLAPVHWQGYIRGMSRYQGVLEDKRVLQEKFETKLAICEAEPGRVDQHDWSGMRAILRHIFAAFEEGRNDE